MDGEVTNVVKLRLECVLIEKLDIGNFIFFAVTANPTIPFLPYLIAVIVFTQYFLVDLACLLFQSV